MDNKSSAVSESHLDNRIIYFDLLRIISICATISVHVIGLTWYVTDITTFTWKVFSVFKSLTMWCVPVFTMISGALFLNPNRHIDTKRLYTHNIRNILYAFFFWNAVYGIIFHFRNFSFSFFISFLFTGDYHMWFVFMIIVMYMLTPILRKVVTDKELTKYLLVLTFVFSFVIPELLLLLSMLPMQGISSITSAITLFFDSIHQFTPTGYIFYFVLGHYLSTYDISKNDRKHLYILGILGYLFAVIFTNIRSTMLGYQSTEFMEKETVNMALMSASIFLFVKYHAHKIMFSGNIIKLVLSLSSNCFGIYLIHLLVLKSIYGFFDLALMPINPFITCLLFPILCFMLCNFIVIVIKKIPVLKHLV